MNGRSRTISAVEFAVAAAIVLAHNVWHVVPNEVLVLVPVGLLSVWYRNGTLAAIGLRRPESWPRVVGIAFAAAVLRHLVGALVVDPLASRYWPPAAAPSGADEITGNPGIALLALLVVWTFAAFGEEIVYRGYMLTRFAEVFRSSTAAYVVGIVAVSVLFGYGHFYKGPTGIIDSGVAGLILGAAFLVGRRNLWTCILAHGFIDTIGVVAVFFGWDF